MKDSTGPKSVQFWDDVIQQAPDYTDAYVERATCHMLTKKWDPAIADLTRALSLDSSHEKALFMRGQCFYESRRYDHALRDLVAVLKRKPNNADGQYQVAMILLARNDLDRAMGCLDQAITADPNHVKSLVARASLRVEKKNFDGAYQDANRVLQVDPNQIEGYIARSGASAGRGNFGRAKEDLNAAIAKNADHPEAHYSLAKLLVKLNQIDEAVPHVLKAVQVNPNLPIDPNLVQAVVTKAATCLQQSNFPEAIHYFEQAASLDGRWGGDGRYHDAVLKNARKAASEKNWTAAISDFEKINNLNPALTPIQEWAGAHRE
ncbi:MAG TPA: tetratricopeptide repeat protein, partial [Planctomycetota bacterium]|nr:tetratricopeptide repeat protein [Planctomycetota bacterium]